MILQHVVAAARPADGVADAQPAPVHPDRVVRIPAAAAPSPRRQPAQRHEQPVEIGPAGPASAQVYAKFRGRWDRLDAGRTRDEGDRAGGGASAGYVASWKMIPSAVRSPPVSVLTPWRSPTR